MSYIGNSPGVASQRITSNFNATDGQTTFIPSSGYIIGYLDVFHNGVKLIVTEDYIANNGITVVLVDPCLVDDNVETVAYIPRGLSDGYMKTEADILLSAKASLTYATAGYNQANTATTAAATAQSKADAGYNQANTATTAAATAQAKADAAATPAYVDTSISNLVNSAPAALNTLNELAAALGNDSNFATTVTNSIATKAPLASPTFTGTVTLPGTTNGVVYLNGSNVVTSGSALTFDGTNLGVNGVIMTPALLTTDFTIPAGYNAVSAGPLTVADGVTATLNDTSNWSIV